MTEICHLLRYLSIFVLFLRDVFLFPQSRNEILNITTYAALFIRHVTAAGTILRFVSESVIDTWNGVSVEVSLKDLSLNIELLREMMPYCTHAHIAAKDTVRKYTFRWGI